MAPEPQSRYNSDIVALREMLREQVELVQILEAKKAEGKRAASLTWAIVRCQSRIAALCTAIELMGGGAL
jgi:hypothetical protein